jgi:hypothetical protein
VEREGGGEGEREERERGVCVRDCFSLVIEIV